MTPRLPLIRPRRLQAGDTLGLINPSGAVYENAPYEQTHRVLQAMGFQVREAPHARARYGHMAGTPEQRASDIHTLFADPPSPACWPSLAGRAPTACCRTWTTG